MSSVHKPVVHYMGRADIIETHSQGIPYTYASLYALDHPKLGRGTVRTSVILRKSNRGIIETMNTIYEPVLEVATDEFNSVD